MLKTLMNIRNINVDIFIKQLQEEINTLENEKNYLVDTVTIGDNIDFYGSPICSMKNTFRDDMESIVKKHYKETGDLLKVFVKSGNKTKDFSDELMFNPKIDIFPNIVFTKEIIEYLGHDFRDKMIGKGYFKENIYKDFNRDLKDIGIIENNEYCIYAVIPHVIVVDTEKLGDRPIPKTLKDLLNPVYKNDISIFGKQKDDFLSSALLYVYKEFGEDGLKKLARNVRRSFHCASMPKVAAMKSKDSPAIYLMSWFFSNTCYGKNIKVIWPEDGAIIVPMYMFVKKEGYEKVKPLVEYIIGEEFGEICKKANVISTNPNIDNNLPKGAKLKWLGWDYIKENDVYKTLYKCSDIFLKEWEKHNEGSIRGCN